MYADRELVHPWHIFSGLFICFWLTSAYFDHFLFTGIFCIFYGVAAEIVTKTMYARKSSAKIDQNKSSIRIETPVNRSELKAKNEAIWTKAEAELDDVDDDIPPPLPDKDYETGKIDTLAEKLQALADESAREKDNATPENEDGEDNAEPDCVAIVARQYNRTVSDEYNQNTSTVNCNLMQEMNNRHTSIEEEPVELINSDDEDDQESSSILEEKRIYAPDSSDDEDEDEDVVSREVNFDELESEEDDFDEYVSNTNQDSTPENSQSLEALDTTDIEMKQSGKTNDQKKIEESAVTRNETGQEMSNTGEISVYR